MRRAGFIAAALLAVAALLVTAAGSSANRLRPRLTVHLGSSLVVFGTHFRSHERVKITSSAGASARVRATARGAFTVTLNGVPVDRCTALIVHARGSAGSLAIVRRPPLPECAPMRSQGTSP